MTSKTIIISAPEDSAETGRGILTLFSEDDLLKCRLRLYNVKKLNKDVMLGIYHNENVYTANLLEKNGVYESSFVGDFNMQQDFYTALIDTKQNNSVILSGGTYQGFYFNDYSIFSKDESLEDELNNSNINENEINQHKDECEDVECDKCAKCKYKEYFYANFKSEEQTVSENVPKNKTESIGIINSIIPQFEYIFKNYEEDKELNALVEDSKFVKINENQEQYSIGVIYGNESIKYICYAVKCEYCMEAPKELGEHYQWLPLDKEDPLSEGYYVVFQDAEDLKILEI